MIILKKNFYDVNDAGRTLLWCLILPQILFLAFELVLMLFAGDRTLEQMLELKPVVILMAMISQVAFVITYYQINKNTNPIVAGKINVKNFGWQNVLICILIGAIGLFAFSPISSTAVEFLKFIGFEVTEGFLFELSNPFWLILALILAAVIPAIVEELIFRGIIFQGLRKYGPVKAILLTSFLFALIHLSAQQFVFPFLFSIVLCYVVLKTNSILASMIIHFVSNAISLFMMYFNFQMEIALPIGAVLLIAIALVFVGYLVIWLLTKLLKNTEREKTTDEILKVVEDAEKAPKFNGNRYYVKLGIAVGLVLWAINLIYGVI